MTARCDARDLPNSMNVTNTGTGTLGVIYWRDKSRGSFTWKGTWTVDVVSGASRGVFDATSAGGDPTFGCSTLHLTFDGYLTLATAFGGYTGKWIHGCRGASS